MIPLDNLMSFEEFCSSLDLPLNGEMVELAYDLYKMEHEKNRKEDNDGGTD